MTQTEIKNTIVERFKAIYGREPHALECIFDEKVMKIYSPDGHVLFDYNGQPQNNLPVTIVVGK